MGSQAALSLIPLMPGVNKVSLLSVARKMRRLSLVRGAARLCLSGPRSKPYPGTPYKLYFDGYRNIGFWRKDLEATEADERAAAGKYLAQRKPQVVWDIGANIGFWSLFLQNATHGYLRELRCFEPDPFNARYLTINRDKNGLGWDIRPVCLSDQTGEMNFYGDLVTGATGSLEDKDFIGKHFSAKREMFTVKTTTIDQEIQGGAQPPGFIKIDVEGHELAVIRGGVETLRHHKPAMILEITKNQYQCTKLLKGLGYKLYDTDGNRIRSPKFSTLALA